MGIKEQLTGYGASVELADGKHVGRVVLRADAPVTDFAYDGDFAKRLDGDEKFQRVLAFCMNNNSPNFSRKPYAIGRGASAYYTWNPLEETVAVEWGEIDGQEAKLHDYLNQVIDPSARHASGMTVRSGHITTVESEGLVVCLLDSTFEAQNIVDTLNKNGFLVVDGLGEIQKLKDRGDSA